MSRPVLAALIVLVATSLVACAVEPKARSLPAGFGEPYFMLSSDEAQGPLLIGSTYGLQKSLDGGRTWTVPDNGQAPAIAGASFASTIMVSRGPTGQVYDFSLKGAAQPTMVWPFPGAVTQLAGNSRRNRLWAITTAGGLRLHYSNDGGRYWWPMAAVGICPRPRGLAVSAPNGPKVERLWVACGRDGLFASDDLGVNFFRIAGISNALTIAAARSTPGQIAVTTPQVVVTKNAGATWFLSGLTATAVAIDPRDPDLVFAAGNNGQLYASLDGGKSF